MAQAQTELPIRFDANAIAMGTSNPPVVPRGGSSLQINVTRWSTEEERAALFGALEEGGRTFTRALNRQDETGWVRVTGRGAGRTQFPTERLRYAREMDMGNGIRRIVLATDRPVRFVEASRMTRSSEFDVTIIVIDIDESGEGEGQLAAGARLELDPEKNTLVIEHFSSEPVRLTRVRKR